MKWDDVCKRNYSTVPHPIPIETLTNTRWGFRSPQLKMRPCTRLVLCPQGTNQCGAHVLTASTPIPGLVSTTASLVPCCCPPPRTCSPQPCWATSTCARGVLCLECPDSSSTWESPQHLSSVNSCVTSSGKPFLTHPTHCAHTSLQSLGNFASLFSLSSFFEGRGDILFFYP